MSLRNKVNQQLKMLSERTDINYKVLQEYTGYNAMTFRRLLNKETKIVNLDIICKLEEAGLIELNIDGRPFDKTNERTSLTKPHERGSRRECEADDTAFIASPLSNSIDTVISLIDFENLITKDKAYKLLSPVTVEGIAVIIDDEGTRFELENGEWK